MSWTWLARSKPSELAGACPRVTQPPLIQTLPACSCMISHPLCMIFPLFLIRPLLCRVARVCRRLPPPLWTMAALLTKRRYLSVPPSLAPRNGSVTLRGARCARRKLQQIPQRRLPHRKDRLRACGSLPRCTLKSVRTSFVRSSRRRLSAMYTIT